MQIVESKSSKCLHIFVSGKQINNCDEIYNCLYGKKQEILNESFKYIKISKIY